MNSGIWTHVSAGDFLNFPRGNRKRVARQPTRYFCFPPGPFVLEKAGWEDGQCFSQQLLCTAGNGIGCVGPRKGSPGVCPAGAVGSAAHSVAPATRVPGVRAVVRACACVFSQDWERVGFCKTRGDKQFAKRREASALRTCVWATSNTGKGVSLSPRSRR